MLIENKIMYDTFVSYIYRGIVNISKYVHLRIFTCLFGVLQKNIQQTIVSNEV